MAALKADDYHPYFERYIKFVPKEDVFSFLKKQREAAIVFFSTLGETRANYRYADGKWSIKQVLGHVIDTERIFNYRALCFSRSEIKHLHGFEQDDYVNNANFDDTSLQSLVQQFDLTRQNTISLFASFSEAMLSKKGIAEDKPYSVLAIAYVIAGHLEHHISIVQERYLGI